MRILDGIREYVLGFFLGLAALLGLAVGLFSAVSDVIRYRKMSAM